MLIVNFQIVNLAIISHHKLILSFCFTIEVCPCFRFEHEGGQKDPDQPAPEVHHPLQLRVGLRETQVGYTTGMLYYKAVF